MWEQFQKPTDWLSTEARRGYEDTRMRKAVSESGYEDNAREESNRSKSSLNIVWRLERSRAQTLTAFEAMLVFPCADRKHGSSWDKFAQ